MIIDAATSLTAHWLQSFLISHRLLQHPQCRNRLPFSSQLLNMISNYTRYYFLPNISSFQSFFPRIAITQSPETSVIHSYCVVTYRLWPVESARRESILYSLPNPVKACVQLFIEKPISQRRSVTCHRTQSQINAIHLNSSHRSR